LALSVPVLLAACLPRPVGGSRVSGVMLRHDELLVGLVESRWIPAALEAAWAIHRAGGAIHIEPAQEQADACGNAGRQPGTGADLAEGLILPVQVPSKDVV